MDSVDGICPAIAIRQRTPSRNPRSTVATATEIHDHLRLLFARVGRVVCDGLRRGGRDATRAESAAERLLRAARRARALLVGLPAGRSGGTPRADLLERLRKRGFRAAAGRRARSSTSRPRAARERAAGGPAAWCSSTALALRRGRRAARLAEALETALREGGGPRAWSQVAGRAAAALLGALRVRPLRAGLRGAAAAPVLVQQPLRRLPDLPRLRQPDRGRPGPRGARQARRRLAEGAIEPWNKPHYRGAAAELQRFARRRGIPLDVPWSDLAEEHRRLVLEGDEEFPGVVGFFRWLEAQEVQGAGARLPEPLPRLPGLPGLPGARLRPEALRVQVGGQSASTSVCALSVRRGAARSWPSWQLEERRARGRRAACCDELERRLRLPGGRGPRLPDASTGPSRRCRAARRSASRWPPRSAPACVGTLYVLDEPSVGLHPRDTDRLIGILKALRDQGNTVRRGRARHARIMEAADHVIDLGPGRGRAGRPRGLPGRLRRAAARRPRSLTGKYLRGELQIPVPARRAAGATACPCTCAARAPTT